MGFTSFKGCRGGLVETHVTAVPPCTVFLKWLTMSPSSLFASWSLAQIKLEPLQNVLPNEPAHSLSVQVNKSKSDLDATAIVDGMADVGGSQQAPVSGLCSSAGVETIAGLGDVSLLHPVPLLRTLFDSLVFYGAPKLLQKTVLFSAGLTIAILKACLSVLHFTAC